MGSVQMQTPTLLSPPALLPVTLAEVKAHLRLDEPDHDERLAALLVVATDLFDGWNGLLRRALITQTWRVTWSAFPAERTLRFPLDPVQSLVVKYFDPAGTEQTLSAAGYDVVSDAVGPTIVLRPGQTWPSSDDRAAPVMVDAVCGYGASAATVPQAIRTAILMVAAELFRRPEGVGGLDLGMTSVVGSLAGRYMRMGC